MLADTVTELIGNTPLVKIGSLSEKSGATILGKCEFFNPSASVKDRIALSMVEDGIRQGIINEDSTIIEPTSGNTGIGLAMVCAAKRIKLILTMPESMSIERRKLLQHLGAKLVLTPASEGMSGAINKAKELKAQTKGAVILQQFANPANPKIHRETTAKEILRDTDGKVDIFVAGVGTGGTITGCGEVLKKEIASLQVIAVEPQDSPVLSGGGPGPHKIQGIGAGFVPDILNTTVYDEVITIGNEEAMETAKEVAKNEGLLVGISSGANLAAALKVANRPQNQGKTIVTILCDTAERYLSTELFA